MAEILIAAHDEALRQLLGTALRRFDHHVTMSVNGEHILYLLRQDIFDLVILDESLQDTMALSILERLNGSRSPDSKIIVLGANTSEGFIKECLQAGACDFIVKPLSLPKLVLRVESLVGSLPAKKAG